MAEQVRVCNNPHRRGVDPRIVVSPTHTPDAALPMAG